ncbi:MAG: RNA polymerase sigma factor [Chitinophagales bacterium]|nr:RNA polymerase sigma factor [Bacteroidota bacterium]MCB9043814.1 RNA polymerase sigma factor [Chitinophagales bacterium]
MEKPNLNGLNDAEIIKLIVEKNKVDYFEELYIRYSEKVYRKSYSMTQNEEDARDLTHDIFIKAFTNLKNFRGDANFSTWIFKITYNECINFLKSRSRKNTQSIENENTFFEVPDMSDREIEDRIMYDIKLHKLSELLTKLPPEENALLLMKYQDDLSINDIATLMEVSSSAVKMRLLRARNHLYNLFVEQDTI